MAWSVQWTFAQEDDAFGETRATMPNQYIAMQGREEAVRQACDMLRQGHRVFSISDDGGKEVMTAEEIKKLCSTPPSKR